MNKKFIILVMSALLFMIVTVPINRFINSSMKEVERFERERRFSPPAFTVEMTAENEEQEDPLIPEDPKDYNILAQKEYELPKSQMHWDFSIRDELVSAKLLNDLERKGAFKRAKRSPQEYARQVAKIEKRIRQYEDLYAKNPDDRDLKRKLRNLYMLKSTLLAFEEKIIAKQKHFDKREETGDSRYER